MRIAFAIVSLFPSGGLQRDCVEIGKLVQGMEHDVVIHTCRVQEFVSSGDMPVVLLQNAAATNHGRQAQFAADLLQNVAGQYDLLVGFDKLSGLDILYCADRSVAYRARRFPPLRLLPRYRTYSLIEQDSFAPGSKTKIILLAQNQVNEYRSAWKTEPDRILLIPPTLTLARRQPGSRTGGIRQSIRSSLGLSSDDWVWLSIGVQPRIKGFDRSIDALEQFPDAKLIIAGLTETNRASAKLARHARRSGVEHRIKWLGHHEDIAQLMTAADLLVHPARYDTTGTVILEAIINGLPVITTAACGYAMHVDSAGAGIVLSEPFEFPLFLAALEQTRDRVKREAWSKAGAQYGNNPVLYQGRLRAAEAIVEAAAAKQHGHFKMDRDNSVANA